MKVELKPLIFEARQMTSNELEQVELEEWCGGSIRGTSLPPEKRVIEVYNQMYGDLGCKVGDWLVKFSKNSLVPNNPQFFPISSSTFEKYFKVLL